MMPFETSAENGCATGAKIHPLAYRDQPLLTLTSWIVRDILIPTRYNTRRC